MPCLRQAAKPLSVMLWQHCDFKLMNKKQPFCMVGKAVFAILRKIKREATPTHNLTLLLLHILFCPYTQKGILTLLINKIKTLWILN